MAGLDQTRATLLKLPRTAETLQWEGRLVFWTLDKSIGGKMFAIIDLEAPNRKYPLSFAAGPIRVPALLERDGVFPAPYLAKAHWVALQDWHVLSQTELDTELKAAYRYVRERMPGRVQRLYDLPQREYRALVRERRR